ncbi:MAG: S1C family serine protease [Opitutaceae bacterium]
MSGSGVIFSEDGHVVTNYHVVRHAVRATAWLADGRERRAEIVGADPPTDLAVLRLRRRAAEEQFPMAQFGGSLTLQPGDPVWAVGSPGNLSQALTAGVVANPRLALVDESTLPLIDGERVGRLVRWLAHDARIFPGNSGGPLIDASGRVVGINEIYVAGLGGAIPVELVRSVADELVARGHVERAWLGVEWQPLPADGGEPAGVRIGTVWPDGPAARAGVEPGTIVSNLGEQPVAAATFDSLVDIERLEEALAIGQPMQLRVSGAAARDIVLAPEARPVESLAPVAMAKLGFVARDLTPLFVWRKRLATSGGWA